MRHAAVIYGVMMIMMVGMIVWCICWDTVQPNPALTSHPGDRRMLMGIAVSGSTPRTPKAKIIP